MKQRGDDNSVHPRFMLCRDPSFFHGASRRQGDDEDDDPGRSLCKFDANLERAAMHAGHDIKALMAA